MNSRRPITQISIKAITITNTGVYRPSTSKMLTWPTPLPRAPSLSLEAKNDSTSSWTRAGEGRWVQAEIQPNAEKKRKRRRRRAISRVRADSIARTADDITDRWKRAMRKRKVVTLAVMVPSQPASRVASAVKLKSRSTSALRSKRGRMLITGMVTRICPFTC